MRHTHPHPLAGFLIEPFSPYDLAPTFDTLQREPAIGPLLAERQWERLKAITPSTKTLANLLQILTPVELAEELAIPLDALLDVLGATRIRLTPAVHDAHARGYLVLRTIYEYDRLTRSVKTHPDLDRLAMTDPDLVERIDAHWGALTHLQQALNVLHNTPHTTLDPWDIRCAEIAAFRRHEPTQKIRVTHGAPFWLHIWRDTQMGAARDGRLAPDRCHRLEMLGVLDPQRHSLTPPLFPTREALVEAFARHPSLQRLATAQGVPIRTIQSDIGRHGLTVDTLKDEADIAEQRWCLDEWARREAAGELLTLNSLKKGDQEERRLAGAILRHFGGWWGFSGQRRFEALIADPNSATNSSRTTPNGTHDAPQILL